MAKLYFDNPQGIILIDGVKCNDSIAFVDGNFCLQYAPYDDSYLPIILAVDGKCKVRDDVIFIRHGKDYIVRFCPTKKSCDCQNQIYIQKVLEPQGATAHCLTCHIEDDCKISVETQNELISLTTPCKVADVKFSCIPITGGQLLSILADLENGKKYMGVLHYKDDYTLLLDICCDEIIAEEDGLRVCDHLCDTLNRKCVRKLSFCGDCFAEQSRHFENHCRHYYIDEILPYALIESVCYGDDERAEDCLCSSLKNCDLKDIFGDFIGICDCLEYKPFEIPLLYSDCNGLYTKTFKFEVNLGKIQKIKLTQI
ncbi:MAG: hypothetical protein K2O35_05150 [Clostridia bacterium]|nr:hypothetical protein [Clostridia bacterium]